MRALALGVVLAAATEARAQAEAAGYAWAGIQIVATGASVLGGGSLAAIGTIKALQRRGSPAWAGVNIGIAIPNFLLGSLWLATSRTYGYYRPGPRPEAIAQSSFQFAAGAANLLAAALNLLISARPEDPEPPAVVPMGVPGRWVGVGLSVPL